MSRSITTSVASILASFFLDSKVANAYISATSVKSRVPTSLFAKKRGGSKKRQKKSRSKKARGSDVFRPSYILDESVPFTPAVLDGYRYYLPAGTIVKHGTSTSNLRSILKAGLLSGFDQGRSERRPDSSALARNGVYVGSCYAVYGSSAYNCNSSFGPLRMKMRMKMRMKTVLPMLKLGMMGLFTSEEQKMRNFQEISKKKYTGIEPSVLDACGLPVVLNIKLQERAWIQADEDYVAGLNPDGESLRAFAGDVWEEFGSTVILQSIPASWIESVECFEPDHRSEMFSDEKCFLLGYDVEDVMPPNPSVQMIIRQEDEMRRKSEESFHMDMKRIAYALQACQYKSQNTRQIWQDSRLNRGGFSRKLKLSDVPHFLDYIEREEQINLLASGYHLVDEFTK